MKRQCGVLMHISTLHGDFSCGSFGKEAKQFIDFLAESGFSWWQTLPFCPVDECNSPYKSDSAFAGNPYFVDLPTLCEKGFITADELESCRQHTPYSCEFVRLYHTRFSVLMKASCRVDEAYRRKVEDFIDGDKYIADFCRYMALKTANHGAPHEKWTTEDFSSQVEFMWKFIQYEFFTQWDKIKSYANQKGIKIMGDIPIYVAPDSCDMWSACGENRFLLDGDGHPRCVAGVPPDYFSEDGQLWGNPLYDWESMKSDGFGWWRARLMHMFRLFDGVRIDHFRGFESYWSVPADAKSAKEGSWIKGPGKEFIDVIKECAGEKLVVAEDLGDITKEVYDLVEYSGFPGMRVLQFGFLDGGDSPHRPYNYPNNSVAYTGTHDNNTLLGYVWELDEVTREKVMNYCGHFSSEWDSTEAYDRIIRTMYASGAGLLILPIQDILGYGSDTRLNIPGKADGNWQYRITKEQLDGIDTKKYRKLAELYGRV